MNFLLTLCQVELVFLTLQMATARRIEHTSYSTAYDVTKQFHLYTHNSVNLYPKHISWFFNIKAIQISE